MKKQEIIDAYNFRHACKLFDVKKVIPKEDIDFILETGRLSPSSFGFEPWKFVVVQDKNLREALKENAWGATQKLDTASHFVLILSAKASLIKWNSAYLQNFMRTVQKLSEDVMKGRISFFEAFQKSDYDLTDDRKIFDWTSRQSYIALGNMMTAAALVGIDSCPIEGFNLKTTESILRDKIGINTEEYGISCMVAFGYRVNTPHPKTRRPIEEVVVWK